MKTILRSLIFAFSADTANNYVYGGSGKSFLYGSEGNDTLIGGSVLFGRIKCEAVKDLEWRIAA